MQQKSAALLRGLKSPWICRVLFVIFVAGLSSAWLQAFKVYKAEALTKTADSLVDLGRMAHASTVAQKAIQLNPRSGYAWFQYGTAQYLQLQFGGSLDAFKQAIPVLPHSYNAIRLMAIAQYKTQQYEAAARNLSDYIYMNPQPAVTPEEIFRMAGLSWLRVGDLSKSNEYLTWASHYSANPGEIRKIQAMVTLLMNQPGTADYYFRAFRFQRPEEDFNPYELMTNALAANKLNGAIAFLASIHERSPSDLSIVKALALAHSRNGAYDKAELLLQEAAEEGPENAEFYLIYGDVLFAQKKFAAAFAQYDRHLQLDPDSRFRQEILKKKATSRF